MSRQSTDLEDELEAEYEDELEVEFEDEFEAEYEDEWEEEDEDFLPILGGIANTLGGLLGEEEGEEESEWELEAEEETEDESFQVEAEAEYEMEAEFEDEGEEFWRGFKRVLRRAAPMLKTLAKTVGPIAATAVAGPAAGALTRALTSQLEGETEEEVEVEFEEMAASPLTAGQALGEYLAAQAASSESETEAEAFAGVAAYLSLSPRDRRDLQRMLPALLRGTAVITRMLHGNRHTRQALRLTPGIVDGAAQAVLRRAAAGQPITPVSVGRALGAAASGVLGTGPARTAVMRRHARGLSRAHRHYRRRPYGRRGSGGHRPSWYANGRRPSRAGVRTIRRQPVRSRTIGGAGRVPRPRPGFVRVVTPVRVPPRGGRPARTVRVVSDVRIPRGAVAVGRPRSVSGARRAR